VRALYDFQGSDDAELSFNVDDKIIIIFENEDGWYYGDLKGKKGFLPSEYVEMCSESEMVLFKPSERLPSHKIPYCHSELYSDGLSFITRIHLSDIQIAKRMLQEAKKLSFQPSLFEREIAPMYSIEYAEIIW